MLLNTIIILNPVSGKKNAEKIYLELTKHTEFAQCPVYRTQYPNHAASLTEQAIAEGARKIIIIGGDGTLHQVVNGIMNQNICPSSEIQVGIISIGTGNDWVKTYKFSKDIQKNIQTLKNNKTFNQDIGKLFFTDQNGTPQSTYFVNMAGLGFDATVVEKSLPEKDKLGPLVYIVGAIKALFGFSCIPLRICIKDKIIESPCYLIIGAINRFAGGGMLFAPNAISDDGLLDIIIIKNMSRLEVILNLYNLFTGSYIKHPKVESYKASEFSVEVEAPHHRKVKTQADGELYLHGPYHFSICPKAIQFIVP